MRQGSNRRPRPRNTPNKPRQGGRNSYDSNGPAGKVRGTAQQVLEKYQALGRDAMTAGDRIGAESYYQFAEHYHRIVSADDSHSAANTDKDGQSSNQNSGQNPNQNAKQNGNHKPPQEARAERNSEQPDAPSSVVEIPVVEGTGNSTPAPEVVPAANSDTEKSAPKLKTEGEASEAPADTEAKPKAPRRRRARAKVEKVDAVETSAVDA